MKLIDVSTMKHPDTFTMVDDEDFVFLSKWKWSVIGNKKLYVARSFGRGNVVLLHRMLMDCPNGMQVDHIDGNGLNNQKQNLRIASASENQCNRKGFGKTSKYKGVSKTSSGWRYDISFSGKRVYGHCKTEVEAANKYNELAKNMHGNFVTLNEVSK